MPWRIKLLAMQIRILAVGKKPQGWVREAENDFLNRIKNFAKVEIELVAPADENSFGIAKACETESQKLVKKIRDDEFIVACDREGGAFSSEKFAQKIGGLRDSGRKICFLIGGSNGLRGEILSRTDLRISFSALTFPHELFRVLLLEQIYRAITILEKRRYHK